APLGGSEGILQIAMLVFEQMPEILVCENAKEAPTACEADGELEIGEIGAAIAASQPVLLLGKIVVANPGPVQLAQRGPGGTEIGAVTKRLGNLQGDPVDPPTHQHAPSGKQQGRPDPEGARNRQPPALSPELVM